MLCPLIPNHHLILMKGKTGKNKTVSARAGESAAQKELPQDVQEGLDKYKQIIQEAETLRDEANAASMMLNALLNGNADQAAAYGITANEAFEKCRDILEKRKVLKDEARSAQTMLNQLKKTLKGLKFTVPAYAHLFQGMSIKAPKKMQLNVKAEKNDNNSVSEEQENRKETEDSQVHVEGGSPDAAGGREVVEDQGDLAMAKSAEVRPGEFSLVLLLFLKADHQWMQHPKFKRSRRFRTPKKTEVLMRCPLVPIERIKQPRLMTRKSGGGVQEEPIDVDQANVLGTVTKNSTRFEGKAEALEKGGVIDDIAQGQKPEVKAPDRDQGVINVDANMSNDNLPQLLDDENDVSGLSKAKKKPKAKTQSKKKRKRESDTDSNSGSTLAQNVPSSSTTAKKKARSGNGNSTSSSGSLQNIKDMVARLISGKSKGGEGKAHVLPSAIHFDDPEPPHGPLGPDPLATIHATDRLKFDKREKEAPEVDKFIDCTEEDKDACAAELAEQLNDHVERGWIIHTNGRKLIRWEASLLGRAMLESRETALHLMTSDDSNILCAYHAHVKKDKVVHDQAEGKDRGWRFFTGVPFVRNASKGSTASANRRPGHLHCGCKEEEVLIEAILRKTTILKSSSTGNEETMQDEHLKPFERSFFTRAFMAWTGLKPGHFFRKNDSGKVQTYGDLLESQIAILEERLAEWKAAQQNEGDN
ncbi:hypothetical protein NP233_g9537 [Leucocoprinus birnbaumii]|uniref:Uncharacterized protein n=1 Tax=Leucocoprinus birnbaumii TaxID=56174 RepID=A0AAD5YSS2_9AGAR|nr:hypothetical protein NP233_g9537 [Leucocoprinus birnbaumii]